MEVSDATTEQLWRGAASCTRISSPTGNENGEASGTKNPIVPSAAISSRSSVPDNWIGAHARIITPREQAC